MKKTTNSKILDLFYIIQEINDNFLDKNEKLIKTFVEYSKSKKAKFEEFNIINENRFCIFDNFSPKYYYEKLHSEILRSILDKNTLELENQNFLSVFLKCLNLREDFCFDDNVAVDLEYPINPKKPSEAIDIFIHDENRALIIENKINNATDQRNQLVRYMKFVEENLKISDYYVIYLTLTPYKKPQIHNYAKEYDIYKNKLINENKLILLSAVENDKSKKSLVNFFLRCEEKVNEQIERNGLLENLLLTKCYVNQYITLLNKLGGYASMESTNRELVKKIYSDKELISSSYDFINFWKNRFASLYSVIFEEMKKEGLSIFTKDEGNLWFYSEVNENCLVYFECNRQLYIGFTANNSMWSKKELNRLTKIIEEYAKKESNYFICKNQNEENEWTWTHNLLKENLSIDELKDIIKKSFTELSKLANM